MNMTEKQPSNCVTNEDYSAKYFLLNNYNLGRRTTLTCGLLHSWFETKIFIKHFSDNNHSNLIFRRSVARFIWRLNYPIHSKFSPALLELVVSFSKEREKKFILLSTFCMKNWVLTCPLREAIQRWSRRGYKIKRKTEPFFSGLHLAKVIWFRICKSKRSMRLMKTVGVSPLDKYIKQLVPTLNWSHLRPSLLPLQTDSRQILTKGKTTAPEGKQQITATKVWYGWLHFRTPFTCTA